MGGSGGGGGAGAVSWPPYLQNTHGKWLDGTTDASGTDLTVNMAEVMEAALDAAGNPYVGLGVYSPSDESSQMDYVVTNLENLRNGFDNNWSGYVNTSLGLLDQIISTYGSFLIPDPQASNNILAQWTLPVTSGYQTIRGDWLWAEMAALGMVDSRWISYDQNILSIIAPILSTPSPDAVNRIAASWVAPSEWIELVYVSATNIKADWQELKDWIDPTLVAELMIADNWQVLPEWVEPEPDANEDIIDNLANETYVADSTNQFGNVLDDQITSDVLPRFEAGMRDINAVMSSAFVIGRSIIEGMRDRDVAKYQADLRYKAFLQRDALLGQAYMQDDQIFAQSTLENNRTKAADSMEKSKTLSQSYLQNDQLNAQSTIEHNRVMAADKMELSKMLAQSHLQTDQLAAQSTLEKNKAIVMFDLEYNKTIAQAYLQYDQIDAQYVDSLNKIYSSVVIENTKEYVIWLTQYNEAILKIGINIDQVGPQNMLEWNKAAASLLGQDISIENQMINDRNKSLAEAYLNYDKVDSDNVKTRNVIASDLMKHHATLAWQGASTMYDGQGLYMEVNKILSNVLVEANRMKYVMNKEWQDKTSEYDVAEGKWELEVFQYGSNLLAAVSGGTGFTPGPTPGASALGGAFSGAAIGAKVSGNSAIGAGAGAVLGGIGGYLLGK